MRWTKYNGSNICLWCSKNTLFWIQLHKPYPTNQPNKSKQKIMSGFSGHVILILLLLTFYYGHHSALGGWITWGDKSCWLSPTLSKILQLWPANTLLDLHNLWFYYDYFRWSSVVLFAKLAVQEREFYIVAKPKLLCLLVSSRNIRYTIFSHSSALCGLCPLYVLSVQLHAIGD